MRGPGWRVRDNALDHVVVVVFENRSLDNVLGRLYGPQDGKTFEGVTGKDLSNPIPEWAEHGAERKVVPYTVATDMDSPNPDTGEEYPHTNTQLYGILSEANRFKLGAEITAPHNAPADGQAPTMDGFVTDYVSTLTAELGRQPTYAEYSQVMTGFTPEQIPVLNGLARAFGVFDHWFCEVPSQTFTNRSFWTAATASGFVVNEPVTNWLAGNTAETIFNRLEQHGKTWKVYVGEPDRFSATGLIHYPRLKDRFATHFVPFAQFEADAAAGDLPDFSYIEPTLILGHGTTTRPSRVPWATASWSPVLTRRRRSWAVRRSWPGSTTPTKRCNPQPVPTSGTPRCSSAGTNRAAPTTTSRPPRCRRRTPPHRPASSGSGSTARATGSGDRGVPVGGRRRGVQPGAPAHLTDRHAAGPVGSRRPAHPPRRRRPDLLPRLHPQHPPRPPDLAGGGPAPGARLHPGCAGPGPDPVHPG
jgi:Phosphoesterase family